MQRNFSFIDCTRSSRTYSSRMLSTLSHSGARSYMALMCFKRSPWTQSSLPHVVLEYSRYVSTPSWWTAISAEVLSALSAGSFSALARARCNRVLWAPSRASSFDSPCFPSCLLRSVCPPRPPFPADCAFFPIASALIACFLLREFLSHELGPHVQKF